MTSIPLGEYLFLRIAQANPKLRSVFGIPGDFNLALLEHLYTDSVASKMEFVGICNELNAAYAADGYAKRMAALGVLITTYGVGELSALNGIAGAFTEYAPVLHIVGTTSTKQMAQAANAGTSSVVNIHHLVQNKNPLKAPDHNVYRSVVDQFCVANESLDLDVEQNLAKIDSVLVAIMQEARPGYLFIPSDISDISVPVARLSQPLDAGELRNEAMLADISAKILSKLYKAEAPSVMGDYLVDRFGCSEEFTQLVESMPANLVKLFTTVMGRNINETLPNYIGVYAGRISSSPKVKHCLEKETDMLLNVGWMNSEINTGGYSMDLANIPDYVEIQPDYVLLDGEYVQLKDASGKRHFSMRDLVARLNADLNEQDFIYNYGKNHIAFEKTTRSFAEFENAPPATITQRKLMDFFNKYLQPDDLFMVETCSFLFGVAELSFPKGVQFYSQSLYGSIGYALPATLGVCRAERDLGTGRRVILVQGDGSAQMTVQELSSFIRHDVQRPEIFLLNNEGYTVERVIKGPTRSYNDIQDNWDWTRLLQVFGDADNEKHEASHVNDMGDLEKLYYKKRSGKTQLYDVKLAKMDYPERLAKMFG